MGNAAIRYVGRFAPSPTGPLHAGSLVAALASWLDARVHGGQWLVRIEDVDTSRSVVGSEREILRQLAACGLHPDVPPVRQSHRLARYQSALDQLRQAGLAYACGCSRSEVAATVAATLPCHGTRQRHAAVVYPGTCRDGLDGKPANAWRFRTDLAQNFEYFGAPARTLEHTFAIQKIAFENLAVGGGLWTSSSTQAKPSQFVHHDPATLQWWDRLAGLQQQDVEREVGDFVLLRADGCFAYQLAVVMDDADQGITHVVRGADLVDNTARQILLQRAIGLPALAYLHVPVVRDAQGEKLSKQTGARAVDSDQPAQAVRIAAGALGLWNAVMEMDTEVSVSALLTVLIPAWRERLAATPVAHRAEPAPYNSAP